MTTSPTQGEHAQPEALRPTFGDLLRNTMAGESNPRRDAYFIREVRRSAGSVNPGRWFEMTDGEGETWLSNPQNMIPLAPAQPVAQQGAAEAELPEPFGKLDRGHGTVTDRMRPPGYTAAQMREFGNQQFNAGRQFEAERLDALRTQQPAPAPAAAETGGLNGWQINKTDKTTYLLRKGQRGTTVSQEDQPNETLFAFLADMATLAAAPQPSPTPQADSQPAKAELFNPLEGGNPETALQMAAVIALRDSQPAPDEFQPCPSCFGKGVDGDADDYGRTIDVTCGECDGSGRAPIKADSQAAPVRDESAAPKLRAMAINYPEGACWDKLDAQTCMEGALEIEALRAARAPADSVTAPAGGVTAEPRWKSEDFEVTHYPPMPTTGMRVGMPKGVKVTHRPTGLFAVSEDERSQHRNREVAWNKLQEILAAAPTQPAQAAPSVLEDADPLQGAANWLAEAHGQFGVAVLQGCLMIGYNRAKRLHDAAIAARKQGGA